MLTYVWASFPVTPEGGGSAAVDLLSNIAFGAVALVISVLAARRTAVGREPLSAADRAATVEREWGSTS
jgi:hypothetical protein